MSVVSESKPSAFVRKLSREIGRMPDKTWRSSFVDYSRLRKQIKKIVHYESDEKVRRADAQAEPVISTTPDKSINTRSRSNKCHDIFWCVIKSEIDKVNTFFVQKEEECIQAFEDLNLDGPPSTTTAPLSTTSTASSCSSADSMITDKPSSSSSCSGDVTVPAIESLTFVRVLVDTHPEMADRLLDAQTIQQAQNLKDFDVERVKIFKRFLALCAELDHLRKFVVLNYIILLKILKKYDKNTMKDSAQQFMGQLSEEPFYTSTKLASLLHRAEKITDRFVSRKRLPSSLSATSPSNNSGDGLCALCSKLPDKPVVLSCQHRFCFSCLAKNSSFGESCPMCKAAVDPNQVHIESVLSARFGGAVNLRDTQKDKESPSSPASSTPFATGSAPPPLVTDPDEHSSSAPILIKLEPVTLAGGCGEHALRDLMDNAGESSAGESTVPSPTASPIAPSSAGPAYFGNGTLHLNEAGRHRRLSSSSISTPLSPDLPPSPSPTIHKLETSTSGSTSSSTLSPPMNPLLGSASPGTVLNMLGASSGSIGASGGGSSNVSTVSSTSSRRSGSITSVAGNEEENDDSDNSRTATGIRVSCHQCKTTKENFNLLFCTTRAERGKRKRKCRKKYCDACLRRSYNQSIASMTPEDIAKWQCPACTVGCTCAACQRRNSVQEGVMPLPLRHRSTTASANFTNLMRAQAAAQGWPMGLLDPTAVNPAAAAAAAAMNPAFYQHLAANPVAAAAAAAAAGGLQSFENESIDGMESDFDDDMRSHQLAAAAATLMGNQKVQHRLPNGTVLSFDQPPPFFFQAGGNSPLTAQSPINTPGSPLSPMSSSPASPNFSPSQSPRSNSPISTRPAQRARSASAFGPIPTSRTGQMRPRLTISKAIGSGAALAALNAATLNSPQSPLQSPVEQPDLSSAINNFMQQSKLDPLSLSSSALLGPHGGAGGGSSTASASGDPMAVVRSVKLMEMAAASKSLTLPNLQALAAANGLELHQVISNVQSPLGQAIASMSNIPGSASTLANFVNSINNSINSNVNPLLQGVMPGGNNNLSNFAAMLQSSSSSSSSSVASGSSAPYPPPMHPHPHGQSLSPQQRYHMMLLQQQQHERLMTAQRQQRMHPMQHPLHQQGGPQQPPQQSPQQQQSGNNTISNSNSQSNTTSSSPALSPSASMNALFLPQLTSNQRSGTVTPPSVSTAGSTPPNNNSNNNNVIQDLQTQLDKLKAQQQMNTVSVSAPNSGQSQSSAFMNSSDQFDLYNNLNNNNASNTIPSASNNSNGNMSMLPGGAHSNDSSMDMSVSGLTSLNASPSMMNNNNNNSNGSGTNSVRFGSSRNPSNSSTPHLRSRASSPEFSHMNFHHTHNMIPSSVSSSSSSSSSSYHQSTSALDPMNAGMPADYTHPSSHIMNNYNNFSHISNVSNPMISNGTNNHHLPGGSSSSVSNVPSGMSGADEFDFSGPPVDFGSDAHNLGSVPLPNPSPTHMSNGDYSSFQYNSNASDTVPGSDNSMSMVSIPFAALPFN